MPLKIKEIRSGSLAEGKLRPDDLIISINGNQINDFLDLQFHSSEAELKIKFFGQKKIPQEVVIDQNWQSPLGIEPVPHRCRTCANNCIFCFIDQMRPGFRKSLYLKDDDYRLSFVYGNFITLTNLSQADIERIICQKLSPLYVSVHTTDPQLHQQILGYRHDFDILKTLHVLSRKQIELHTQIVVIPGWNDGEVLQKTLADLTSLKIRVSSVGIVPVGLTKFRQNLAKIEPVDQSSARDILTGAARYPNTYCADEIFLLAGMKIPPLNYYADFPQLENGIGMLRLLQQNWKLNKSEFLQDLLRLKKEIVLITGSLAYDSIRNIADDIKKLTGLKIRVQKVRNDFFGSSVTVAGLLSGQDIIEQTHLNKNEIAVLSSSIFNCDNKTLDDFSPSRLKKYLNDNLLIVDEIFQSWKII